jgi:hypothetical protein
LAFASIEKGREVRQSQRNRLAQIVMLDAFTPRQDDDAPFR